MTSAKATASKAEATPALALALLAILGSIVFVLGGVIVHVLRPDLLPTYYSLSQYARGPYGLLMTTALCALALSLFALGLGLYRVMLPIGRSQTGLVLLGVAGVGTVLVGTIPEGAIHVVGGMGAFVAAPIGALLVATRLGKDPRWQSVQRPALSLALLSLAALAVFVFDRGPLVQKILAALIVLWMLVMAVRLRSVAASLLNAESTQDELANTHARGALSVTGAPEPQGKGAER